MNKELTIDRRVFGYWGQFQILREQFWVKLTYLTFLSNVGKLQDCGAYLLI